MWAAYSLRWPVADPCSRVPVWKRSCCCSGRYELHLPWLSLSQQYTCTPLQILGTPTEETWPGITQNTEFLSGHYPVYRAEPLSLHAPRLDGEAIDLLGKFLQFESKNRVPAKPALAHPYFQSLGQRIHSLPNSEFWSSILTTLSHYTVAFPDLQPSQSSPYQSVSWSLIQVRRSLTPFQMARLTTEVHNYIGEQK